MTANKRIFLNVVVTYSRSLYGLALGLFTSRWALQALGEVDYGLLELVGGLIGFMAFFNSLLAVSTSRFFAFSVGQRQVEGSEIDGLAECRDWFSAAFSVHFALAALLVVIGYPIGIWAVKNYLTIPPDRIGACIWVWRMVCLNCFVAMINVPFSAMYTARQELAEQTIYSFFTTTANAVFMYYTITHPGDWLAGYAVWSSILTLLPQIIMCIRAFVVFDECRFTRTGFGNLNRIKQMFGYSAAQFLADFAGMISGQGTSIVINKMLGPACNAAMAIGNKVAGYSLILGQSMIGALNPAITNAAGAKQYERMRMLSYQSCKLSCIFILFFAIPLSLEIDEVMILWLKTPPAGSGALCVFALATFVAEKSSTGLSSPIEALGRIAAFKTTMGILGFAPLVFVIVFVWMGFGLVAAGMAGLCSRFPLVLCRLYFARRLAGISVRYWTMHVAVPIMVVIMGATLVGGLPRFILPQSFWRVVVTTIVSECAIFPLIWFVAFSATDRLYVKERIVGRIFAWKR